MTNKIKKIKELALKVIDGKLNFVGKDATEYKQLMQQREGMYVKIVPYDPHTRDQRRYLEGAVTEYFQLQHFHFSRKENKYVRLPREYVRKMLKREFNGEYIPTLDGGVVKEGKSTQGASKKQLNAYIERIVDYMERNGQMFPLSEDFNAWLDTAPPLRAVYPPLKELRAWSDTELHRLNNPL